MIYRCDDKLCNFYARVARQRIAPGETLYITCSKFIGYAQLLLQAESKMVYTPKLYLVPLLLLLVRRLHLKTSQRNFSVRVSWESNKLVPMYVTFSTVGVLHLYLVQVHASLSSGPIHIVRFYQVFRCPHTCAIYSVSLPSKP